MLFVLDQNMSRTSDLSQHLASGKEVIVIDDFFVEIFKSEAPTPIFQKNIKIIKEYPLSIYYGKSRSELLREELKKGVPLSKMDLICDEYTQKTRQLLSYSASKLESGLSQFKFEAKLRESESLSFSEEYIRGLSAKADLLDIKQYRHDSGLLERHICEVSMSVLEMTLKNSHGESYDKEKFKTQKSVSYIQNYILLWRCINWALKKGYQNAKNIDHDNFDLKYVLTSCFFDGLLTRESWMNDCRDSVLSSVNNLMRIGKNSNHVA